MLCIKLLAKVGALLIRNVVVDKARVNSRVLYWVTTMIEFECLDDYSGCLD